MRDVARPDWWRYPVACPAGHPWGPGRVIVGWMPCDCPGALRHPGRGHLWVRCGTKGCTATWYRPRHGSSLRGALDRAFDLTLDGGGAGDFAGIPLLG